MERKHTKGFCNACFMIQYENELKRQDWGFCFDPVMSWIVLAIVGIVIGHYGLNLW